jgi:hypothetical protein
LFGRRRPGTESILPAGRGRRWSGAHYYYWVVAIACDYPVSHLSSFVFVLDSFPSSLSPLQNAPLQLDPTADTRIGDLVPLPVLTTHSSRLGLASHRLIPSLRS